MSYFIVALVALVVSGLTLFTGFGLGTLLLPAFAVFFPVEVAVAATAVVHGANNLFKFFLLHRSADRTIVFRFGLPAVGAAFVGAVLLTVLSKLDPVTDWNIFGRTATITPLKLIMGLMIVNFAVLDLMPALRRVQLDTRWLPLGGVISGFFGGLSGHQGALRAAFLGRVRLDPAGFAATQAVIATMVDGARLLIYGVAWYRGKMAGVEGADQWSLVGVATVSAFAGALIGKSLLPKMTMNVLRYLTGGLLLIVGLALAAGLI